MAAISHDPAFARRVGVPQSVGREFNEADKGTGILRHHRAEGGTTEPQATAGLAHLAEQLRRLPPEPLSPTPEPGGTFARLLRQGGGEPIPLRAAGGGLGSFQEGGTTGGLGWQERNDYYEELHAPNTGLIASSVAGRTDRLPLAVATESHVIPADVVSGLGQGNTLAGARILDAAMRTGPYGTALPHPARGPGPALRYAPREPYFEQRQLYGFAEGGRDHTRTSVLVAGGEYLVTKEDVERIGGGNLKRGHQILDEMIHRVRDHQRKFLAHAPEPKK